MKNPDGVGCVGGCGGGMWIGCGGGMWIGCVGEYGGDMDCEGGCGGDVSNRPEPLNKGFSTGSGRNFFFGRNFIF